MVLSISDIVDCFAVMVNPASLAKHQASPKVAAVISTILTKFLGLR